MPYKCTSVIMHRPSYLSIRRLSLLPFESHSFCRPSRICIFDFLSRTHARIQRGGGRGSGPPLRFVRGGVLSRSLMDRRGGPKVVFILFSEFFSGSLRSPVLYINSLNICQIRIQASRSSYTRSLALIKVQF